MNAVRLCCLAACVLAADGPGLEVTVIDVLNKGGLVRVECRAGDGQLIEVDLPRAGRIEGLCKGSGIRVRPSRVFVFPDAPAG